MHKRFRMLLTVQLSANKRINELNKQELRIWAKNERKKLDIEALSKLLAEKLQQTEEYKKSKNIMIFYPLENEINLLSLLNDTSKSFYLPKIDGRNMLCCRFDKTTELCESCFHTKEPESPSENSSLLDLIIVPALAVDKNNYRLGYGKGFYDRFLSAHSEITSAGLCYHSLLSECIPSEPHDISVDYIITEKGIIEING